MKEPVSSPCFRECSVYRLRLGTAGGTGCVIEFAGDAVKNFSMEARMSICNMAIEGGARAGLIAPDQAGLSKLNPPSDPQLESTRFQPLMASSEKTGFKICFVKVQLVPLRRGHLRLPQGGVGTFPSRYMQSKHQPMPARMFRV